MDNAISLTAAKTKGLRSLVAGRDDEGSRLFSCTVAVLYERWLPQGRAR